MFRINQKVVCIRQFTYPKYPNESYPIVGEIYSVREVIYVGHECGIRLNEIRNPTNLHNTGFSECIFSTDHFRPVVNVGESVCAEIESIPFKDLKKEFEKEIQLMSNILKS